LLVIVADDSRWSGGRAVASRPDPELYPELAKAVQGGEVLLLDKAVPRDLAYYRRLAPAVVFVVTPDYTHSSICETHLDRASTIFVEKPFDADWQNVQRLLAARGRAALDTQIYALDHYRSYAWRLKERRPCGTSLLEAATAHLGGALRSVRFCMTETKEIEKERKRALQYGLMLDLLPHCLGMLAFFGSLSSVDELEIRDVARYRDAPIESETYAAVRFTFEDYSGNRWRVPCSAWVGKGLSKERKYFEVTGRNGNTLLVAFKKTLWMSPDGEDQEVYPGIWFVKPGQPLQNPMALEQGSTRYTQLLLDLVTGERQAITSAMPLVAGEEIVRTLDSLWNAIQARPTWHDHEVGALDCF
jgi:predicted dehydrogenase